MRESTGETSPLLSDEGVHNEEETKTTSQGIENLLAFSLENTNQKRTLADISLDNLASGTEPPTLESILYVPLPETDISVLHSFLETLGINPQELKEMGISEAHLRQLLDKEMACTFRMKWSSIDHLVEKYLQWPLLSPKDVNIPVETKNDCRFKPEERSILLKSTWGLMKAYAARGFAKGLADSLLKSVHYFIYIMLGYRLTTLIQTGEAHFGAIQEIFERSEEKGIDSLVVSLAKLDAAWLKLILSAPLLIGLLYSLPRALESKAITPDALLSLEQDITVNLNKPGGFCVDFICDNIPGFSTASKLQILEQLVRWDGRIISEQRKQTFKLINRVAVSGKRFNQMAAMESLAKIAHGIGLKDLPNLLQAGYSKEDLLVILYTKAAALETLESLTKPLTEVKAWKALTRRLYASYLLWWLGQATSFWKQKLPFGLFKITLLGLELFFIQKIMLSVLEAIRCPDKPGFQFGHGYADWASDYTADCFSARIAMFRSIDINESVEDLILEIPRYHLKDLKILDLSYTYLTSSEALPLLQAIVKQDASSVKELWINNNSLTDLSKEMFTGFNNLQELLLYGNQLSSLEENVFFTLTYLILLRLDSNYINDLSDYTFSRLTRLQYLHLYRNNLKVLSGKVFFGLNQLQVLDLEDNQLTDIHEESWENCPQLQVAWLNGNQFNATFLMNMFPKLPPTLVTLNIARNHIDILPENYTDFLPTNISQIIIGGNFVPNTLTAEFITKYFPVTLSGIGIEGSGVVDISDHAFANHPTLKRLSLADNRLSEVSLRPETFSGLTQLVSLKLEYNYLKTLDRNIFSSLGKLKYLYLSFNQLTELKGDVFSYLSQLVWIFLPYNQLSRISPQAFYNLSLLEELQLQGNLLTHLDEKIFSGLKNFKDLSLEYNQLSNLGMGIFSELKNMHGIWLNNNNLNDVTITNLTVGFPEQLNDLHLENNEIGDVGAKALARLLPCTQVISFTFSNNSINDLSLINLLQQETLQKFCDDRLCHANLPASISCNVPDNSLTSHEMITSKKRFKSMDRVSKYRLSSDINLHLKLTSSLHWISLQSNAGANSSLSITDLAQSSNMPSNLNQSLLLATFTLSIFSLGMFFYKKASSFRQMIQKISDSNQNIWRRGHSVSYPILATETKDCSF